MKKILLINFFVILTIIISSELILRNFTNINTLGFEDNLFQSNNNIVIHNKNIKSKVFGIEIFTDSNGFRVPYKEHKYKNKESILILGDSVSFGVGVSENKTIAGLFRKQFNYNIHNSSVAGHNIFTHAKLLPEYLKTIEPEKLLIFLCLNDIYINQGVIKESNLSKSNNNLNKSFISKLKRNYFFTKLNIYFRDKSKLYVFLKSVLSKPQERYYNETYQFYNNEKDLDQFKKYLNEVKLISGNLNTNFIILPYEYQTRTKNCKDEILLPQVKIKDILKELELDYHDLTSDFCEHKTPKNLFLKFDPVHLSEEGHNLVFELISKNNIL